MSKVILVTSCKGGIGKSTVAANLSMALAMQGHRVLTVDCDFTMRSLDLIMGLENKALFSMLDVLRGNTELERAIVKDDRTPNLYFLTAPVSGREEIDNDGFAMLFEKIRECKPDQEGFDYVIVDAPAADSDSVSLAAAVSDEAVIVCSHMPTAIRAAEQTSVILSRYENIIKQRLVINSFDVESALRMSRAGIIDMIDLSRLMLVGVVPYDRELMIAQEGGMLVDGLKKNNNAKKAFENIAKRIDGRQIRLFNGFSGRKYKKLLTVKTHE